MHIWLELRGLPHPPSSPLLRRTRTKKNTTTKKSTIDTHNKGPVEGREPPDSRVTVPTVRSAPTCLIRMPYRLLARSLAVSLSLLALSTSLALSLAQALSLARALSIHGSLARRQREHTRARSATLGSLSLSLEGTKAHCSPPARLVLVHMLRRQETARARIWYYMVHTAARGARLARG